MTVVLLTTHLRIGGITTYVLTLAKGLRAQGQWPVVASSGGPGVEALTRAGRSDPRKLEEAQLLFERMLGYANHLGLYAEQTGSSGEALGN